MDIAFYATNSIFISAGTAELTNAGVTVPAAGTVSTTHPFYMPGTTYYVDSAPFTCAAGVLSTTTGGNKITVTTGAAPAPYTGPVQAKGGFGDIGFLPAGTLYFYYGVGAETVANAAAPTVTNLAAGASLTATAASAGTAIVGAFGTNSSCGGGYIAVAQSNFAGSNMQAYAEDDYSSSANLIQGVSY